MLITIYSYYIIIIIITLSLHSLRAGRCREAAADREGGQPALRSGGHPSNSNSITTNNNHNNNNNVCTAIYIYIYV